jgi:hypothetical protein
MSEFKLYLFILSCIVNILWVFDFFYGFYLYHYCRYKINDARCSSLFDFVFLFTISYFVWYLVV